MAKGKKSKAPPTPGAAPLTTPAGRGGIRQAWTSIEPGTRAQWVSAIAAALALGASASSLYISVPLQTRVKELNEQAARRESSADEREVLRRAREALAGDSSSVWSWAEIRKWASGHADELAELSAAGPERGDRHFSPRFEARAATLEQQWKQMIGPPSVAGVTFCLGVERELLALQRALEEGRVRQTVMEVDLGAELRRFGDDLAPRCALTVARLDGDRALFVAAYFFPSTGREHSAMPYQAIGPNWLAFAEGLLLSRLRLHPDILPPVAKISLPANVFAGCNGSIARIESSTSPGFRAGFVRFVFTAKWTVPGARTPCLLVGSTEMGLLDLGRGQMEERPVPPRGSDWVRVDFSADGDVDATLYAAEQGVPIRARVPVANLNWRQRQDIGVEWDVTALYPEKTLRLTVGQSSALGEIDNVLKNGLSDPRSSSFGKPDGRQHDVALRCDVRVGQQVVDQIRGMGRQVPPCFLRRSGAARKYTRCRIPAVQEVRFGELWTFVTNHPAGIFIIPSTCDVLEGKAAWEAEPMRCVMKRKGGDCLRRQVDGTLTDPGDSVVPVEAGVGSGCLPAPCVVTAGDIGAEPEE